MVRCSLTDLTIAAKGIGYRLSRGRTSRSIRHGDRGFSAVFGMGCLGGVLAEVLHWWGLRQAEKLPKYATSGLYWAVTVLMVLVSGALAWVYISVSASKRCSGSTWASQPP
jgi:hypothetical protein